MAGMVPIIQWNSKAGDLLSPPRAPAKCMGISPPSGNALEVTDNAGPLPPPFPPPPPGPPGPPFPPPAPGGGPCAITNADMTAIAVHAVIESILLIIDLLFCLGL